MSNKKILVLNSGSSSVKFKIFKIQNPPNEIASGIIDGIGLLHCETRIKSQNDTFSENKKLKNHLEAIKELLSALKTLNIIKNFQEITLIGHRVVHGGEKLTAPIIIDKKTLNTIKDLQSLAPLHNPANITGIEVCNKLLGSATQVAVFDTAFHQTMPIKAFLYGLPLDFYTKKKIRKYGFHGISHKYVVEQAIKILKNKNAKIISCHLGNGSSITASYKGKSVDTSMGFTPLEGIMMGTRSGSIDPSIIFHLQKAYKLSNVKIEEILLRKSGILGVSTISSDMRKIHEAADKKNPEAMLTIELLAYQIAKTCCSYLPALGGLDAIVFTGGMGENAFYLRKKICQYFNFLGLKLNDSKNKKSETTISDDKSKLKAFVIKTNEELEIANEVLRTL